ncbi:MAG: HAD family phosphatase [Paludibacteraceae bacterium]|nr:HAD family phosphatase [Paludibacteraceae bacterium]
MMENYGSATFLNDEVSTLMFDFGGVLVNLCQQRCVEAFTALGVNNISDYIGKYSQNGLFLELEKGTVSRSQFYDALRLEVGLDCSDRQIDDAWNAFLVDIPDSKLSMLHRLRRHYRVIMLSNTNEIHWQWALNAFGDISRYFDRTYLSFQIKEAKPDRAIFDYVLRHENVEPSRIFFIDDGPKNIQMADSLGFQTYLASEGEDFHHLFQKIDQRP